VTRGTNTVKSSRILGTSASLVVLGLAFGAPAACSQPLPVCTVQNGEAIARYTLVSQTGDCSNSVLPLAQNADTANYLLGMEAYVPSPADSNAANEVGSMAIQAEWLGARYEDAQLNAAIDPTQPSTVQTAMQNYPYPSAAAVPAPPPTGPASTNFIYAWGKFDTVYPEATGLCKVSSGMTSDVNYPEIPAHLPYATVASPIGDPTWVTGLDPTVVKVCSVDADCKDTNMPPVNAPPCMIPAGAKSGLCSLACSQDSDCNGGDPNSQSCVGGVCTVPDNPATSVKYAWTNVRVYVTASQDGPQTFADLTATQDGCSISYHVSILVPRVPCSTSDANGNTVAEPTLCDPLPDGPDNLQGSGINQAITPSCENIGTDDSPDWECLPPKVDPLSLIQ
jgi:hypothetical protein